MRTPVTKEGLAILLRELGKRSRGPGRVYVVGGCTALLLGFRSQTIDLDLKLDPEPEGVFEAIATIKNDFDMNIELAAPDDFIPPLPGWKERSIFIEKYGSIEFFHYDLYAQALAKIERGHAQDMLDFTSLIRSGRVRTDELWRLFESIREKLIRYPSIDPGYFEKKVRLAIAGIGAEK